MYHQASNESGGRRVVCVIHAHDRRGKAGVFRGLPYLSLRAVVTVHFTRGVRFVVADGLEHGASILLSRKWSAFAVRRTRTTQRRRVCRYTHQEATPPPPLLCSCPAPNVGNQSITTGSRRNDHFFLVRGSTRRRYVALTRICRVFVCGSEGSR